MGEEIWTGDLCPAGFLHAALCLFKEKASALLLAELVFLNATLLELMGQLLRGRQHTMVTNRCHIVSIVFLNE